MCNAGAGSLNSGCVWNPGKQQWIYFMVLDVVFSNELLVESAIIRLSSLDAAKCFSVWRTICLSSVSSSSSVMVRS